MEYKSEFPESLLKAYREMNHINDRITQKFFKEKRKKLKNHANQNFDIKPKQMMGKNLITRIWEKERVS